MSERGMKCVRCQGCKMSDTIGFVPVSSSNIGVIKHKKKNYKKYKPKMSK